MSMFDLIKSLIVMKTDTGRGKDRVDIDELRKIKALWQ